MAFINNGFKRATTLTIQTVENSIPTGTAQELPLMEAFTWSGTTYPAVTSTQIQQMSTADYTARVTAYAAYVSANYQSQYPGLAVGTEGARVYDDTACPLP